MPRPPRARKPAATRTRKPLPDATAQGTALPARAPKTRSQGQAARKAPVGAAPRKRTPSPLPGVPAPAGRPTSRKRARAAAYPDQRQARLWRALRLLWRAPGFVQAALILGVLAVLLPASNWVYQVARKPSELFFPVSDTLFKTPAETWATYAPLFHAHSTPLMTPELLAALAQSEASGNPVARTYWRWSWSLNPFEIYRPASSAVGMYQITDGTFEEARRYCIRNHRVTADGPWHDWDSCWFNGLYTRVLPSHAVEMTAANLDRRVHETLARKGITRASLKQKQDLAIVTHLCGAGAGAKFAARGLRPSPAQRCGDHPLQHYLDRVHGYARVFARLRARG